MTAAATAPELTDGDLDELVLVARRPDAEGRVDGDDGWEPTWALGVAAAEGWRWKAGRVADRVDFSADGTRLSRSQLVDHCLRMADVYGRRRLSTIVLSGTADSTVDDCTLSPLALPGAAARGDNTA